MLSIDFVQSPFTGNDFLGILLDTSQGNDEFFIELFIISPFELVTNKIFCLKSNNIQLYTTLDSFYTYFYNQQNSRIYRIRRGIYNRISDIIFSVEIQSIIKSIANYYDSSNNKTLLLVNSNLIYNFDKAFSNFSCNICSPGTYFLQYSRFTDACASNIQKKPMGICRKVICYKIKVHSDEISTDVIVVIVVVIVALIVVIILTIVLCGRYNNCFQKNNLKLIKIDKNERSELYKEKSETTSTENKNKKQQYRNISIDYLTTDQRVINNMNQETNDYLDSNNNNKEKNHLDKNGTSIHRIPFIVIDQQKQTE